MIVEPDFPDHWKTQYLIQLTGEPSAPMLMIRLWAFCQQRKTSHFTDLTDQALAAVCRWTRKPEELRAALIESKFLVVQDELLIVHEWDHVNAKLVANWKNGPKGGRPVTHREPTENPQETDKIDKIEKKDGIGEDKKSPQPPPAGARKRRGKSGVFPAQEAEPTASRLVAVGDLLRREHSTIWTAEEFDAFKAGGLDQLSAVDFEAQVSALRPLYAATIPREKDYRRRGVLTLLRHWPGELDRARAWNRDNDSGLKKL